MIRLGFKYVRPPLLFTYNRRNKGKMSREIEDKNKIEGDISGGPRRSSYIDRGSYSSNSNNYIDRGSYSSNSNNYIDRGSYSSNSSFDRGS